MSFRERVEKQVEEFKVKFEEAREAHVAFKNGETFGYRRNGQRYQIPFNHEESLKLFLDKTNLVNSIVYPALDKMKNEDKSCISILFAYLWMQNRYFRSGYIKEEISKVLKKIQFNEEENQVLEEIILSNLIYAGREIKYIAKLIPKIDNEDFRNKIYKLNEESDDYVKKRIDWVIKTYCKNR